MTPVAGSAGPVAILMVPGAALADAELEAAGAVAAEQVDADLAGQRAADLGDPDLEHDLLRRRGAQAADHLRRRRRRRPGRGARPRPRRRAAATVPVSSTMPFIGVAVMSASGIASSSICVDRAEILADADVGRIDDPAGAVGRVDRGAARRLAEDVDLARRAGPGRRRSSSLATKRSATCPLSRTIRPVPTERVTSLAGATAPAGWAMAGLGRGRRQAGRQGGREGGAERARLILLHLGHLNVLPPERA